MQPKAARLSRVLGALALVGGLTATALAQDPVIAPGGNLTFSLSSAQGAPGDTVDVTLSVSGGVTDSAALNFTVVVAEGADLIEGNLRGASLLTGYEYEFNTTASGQYRAVLYPAPGTSPAPFNTATSVDVARLSFDIKADAAGGQVRLSVVNKFDADGITGLVGLSNAAGSTVINAAETVSANGNRAINVVDAVVTVADFTKIEFNSEALVAGWNAFQVVPSFRQYLPTATGEGEERLTFAHSSNVGVLQTSVAVNGFSFGFLTAAESNRVKSDVVAAGDVLVQNWTLTSTATNPNQSPKIRARSNADGFSELTIVQETVVAGGDQGFSTVPVGAGAYKLQHLSSPISSAFNGVVPDLDGFQLSLDFETYVDEFLRIGADGVVVTASEAELRTFTPPTTGGTEVLNLTFAGGETNGFTNPGVFGLPVAVDTSNGLKLTPSGPPVDGLAFAWFENKSLPWTVGAGKLYKVDYNVSSDAPTPIQSNIARLRVAVEEVANRPDYVREAVIESGGDGKDAAAMPSTTGSDYTIYIRFPEGLVGQQVAVFFDAYQTTAFASGGVTLNSLKVTAFDAPAILD